MFSLYIVQGLLKVPLQPFVLICMVHMIVQNYIASWNDLGLECLKYNLPM